MSDARQGINLPACRSDGLIMNEKLKLLAKDLTRTFPRSPRETLGGYVIAGRALDKCRAVLAETAGEYHFDYPLDRQFFDFTGIDSNAFKSFVADVVIWNNKLRHTRPCDMPAELQIFLEDYIAQFVPKNRPVYVWFDVYDLEEQRI